MEKPYSDGPLPPGVVAHVRMARSAHTWRADVEAYLAERGLTTELAPTVCDLIDANGLSLSRTVDMLVPLLRGGPNRPEDR